MDPLQATLIIGDTTIRKVKVVFGPTGALGELIVPVYLKAIFGRGLRATLGVDGVGTFGVGIGAGARIDGGEALGTFEVLSYPPDWSPP
jgi:hypothetical protein